MWLAVLSAVAIAALPDAARADAAGPPAPLSGYFPRGPRAVEVFYKTSTPCVDLDRVRVTERRRSVRVTVFTRSTRGRGELCAQVIAERVAVVRLRAPLRRRRVIDGGRGRRLRRLSRGEAAEWRRRALP